MFDILRDTRWANSACAPIAGDASARRYFRIGPPDAILMDDPTHSTQRFADVANALLAIGLSAPEIHAHNPDSGTMIIADLGQTEFAKHLTHHPSDAAELYKAATDVLLQITQRKPALKLSEMTHQVAVEMIDLAALHYADNAAANDDIASGLRDAFDAYVAHDLHFALRDFHAENLIWRPDRFGLDQVGLLDFQDACFAPIGYDMMSLIRDARRDVPSALADKVMADFCHGIGETQEDLSAHLACVGVQRNLRILGIFARLARQENKPQYLALLPRVWRCLMIDLDHPALGKLRGIILGALPPPDNATLQRLTP